jgi:Xaa-Pro aminopeptidase/Xaa-Pro dipeptidase
VILFDHDRAIRLMERHGVDVLLPHTLLNAGYLADHWYHLVNTTVGPYTTFDVDESYLFMVGLPSDRQIEPFVTCRRGAEEGEMFVWQVWIDDKRVWGPNVLPRSLNSPLGPAAVPYTNPFSAVAAAIQERRLNAATIGIEKQFFSVGAFEKLQRALPDAKFVEVSDLFLELRMVKTAEEIRRLRLVTTATQNALAEVIRNLKPGTSGLGIERILGAEHYRSGVRHEWCHTQFGPLGIDVTAPHAGTVERGMAVRIDVGASFRGYQSDLSPVISVGAPSAGLTKAHAAVRHAMDAVLDALRPGAKAADVFSIGDRLFREARLENYLMYVAHGVGRNVHEEPVLAPGSLAVLEAGMVLAVEMVTVLPHLGMVGLEDDVLITTDGHEDLTTIGRDLHVTAV